MQRRNRPMRGFTLIELLVVLLILGMIPCRGLRMAGCRAGLRHRDLAAHPRPG